MGRRKDEAWEDGPAGKDLCKLVGWKGFDGVYYYILVSITSTIVVVGNSCLSVVFQHSVLLIERPDPELLLVTTKISSCRRPFLDPNWRNSSRSSS